MSVKLLKNEGLDWLRYGDTHIEVADAIGEGASDTMAAGYSRWPVAGETMEWSFSYDEVLYITKGAIKLHVDGDVATVRAGELAFIEKGTELVYETAEDDSELVYVSYPQWQATQKDARQRSLMERFEPAPIGK